MRRRGARHGTARRLWRISARMRALVVTNMWPSPAAPARGHLRPRPGRGAARARRTSRSTSSRSRPGGYARARAARDLRRRTGAARLDVVHAHFGLTAWPALAARGAPARRDAARHRRAPPALGPRSARAVLGRMDLVATVQRRARRRAARAPGPAPRRRPALRRGHRRASARSRGAEARERLGLDPDEPLLLLPGRPRAAGQARRPRPRGGRATSRLLTLGDAPTRARSRSGSTRRTPCSCPPTPRVRPRRAGGARLRRPRAGHARRRAPGRRSTGVAGTLCAPFDVATSGAPPSHAHLGPPIRASTGAHGPSCGPRERMAERVARGLAGARPGPRVYSPARGADDGAVLS